MPKREKRKNIFEVREIIDRKTEKDELYYKILWKGYSDHEWTW
jgi:hypothetical protein